MKKPILPIFFAVCLWVLISACQGENDASSPVSAGVSPSSPNTSTPTQPRPTKTATNSPINVAVVETATRENSPDLTPEENHQEGVAPAPRFESPEYGIQTFMWWRPEIAERDLGLVQELKFQWVKQAFAWRDIETLEKGKYDWWRPDNIVNAVEGAGLDLIVRIDRQPFWSQEIEYPPLENAPPADYQDFGDFCGVLGERYRGRIKAYQVWNEPNLSREWGNEPPDPVAYTRLLRICYEAIKQADPEALVISAGLAPTGTGLPEAMPDGQFLQKMYEAGGARYFDVLGLNAPGYKAPPEASPAEGEENPDYGGGRWFVFRHVEDMRAIMEANGDGSKQVAILELGWTTDEVNPSYAWHAVTEEEKADYLVRAYQYAAENWHPWIGPIVAIYIADYDWSPESDEQWWWAITLPDGTKRPAFFALQQMEK